MCKYLTSESHHRLGLLTRHRWKPFEKFVESRAIGQIVPQSVNRNARAGKDKPSTESIGVNGDWQLLQVVLVENDSHDAM